MCRMVTLAEAIGLAGPLPERAVRILGAGLAETLSRVHATGAVLQGLAPETVLLAEDGPRLTAFGPLGAAAAAEAREGGQLSVRLGYLTPEQVEGKEVGPASDLFVLGLLLAYAATGATPLAEGPVEEAAERIAHGSAELGDVPDELRALIARCLAKDPDDRPAAGAVAAELALEGAAGLAKGGWLPGPLAAAVTDQAARVRALETPVEAAQEPVQDAVPTGAVPRDEAPAGSAQHTGTGDNGDIGDIGEDSRTTRFLGTGARAPQSDRATTQLALPREPYPRPPRHPPRRPHSPTRTPTRPRPPRRARPPHPPRSRRPCPPRFPPPHPPARPAPRPRRPPAACALLTTVAAGAAGLVLGGAAVSALGSDDPASPADDKPAAGTRPAVPGRAPDPRWMYTHPAAAPAPSPRASGRTSCWC